MKKLHFVLIVFLVFSGVEAQIINFPDANFKQNLLNSNVDTSVAENLAGNYFKIDANGDGEIQQSEALQVKTLDISAYVNMTDITGIEYFTNLQYLNCSANQISFLNLTNNTLLNYLDCSSNNLTSLDVSSNHLLAYLDFSYNSLTTFNINGNTALTNLYCNNNLLTSINVDGDTSLVILHCFQNQLTSLNLNSNISLDTLYSDNNQLISLFIKNGDDETYLEFAENPSLQYICADESQFSHVQSLINTYGITSTCQVNSYCSFTPGGSFYNIQGTNRYDSNNNGCDAQDGFYPNMKFNFNDGTQLGSLIANPSGQYFISLQEGSHSVTPIFENPTYFSAIPTTVTVTFPGALGPFIQDFCITANGTHNDLEVNILPIKKAQPGFNASYKIVYTNKGTNTQNGTVNLNFEDTVLDYVSAIPTVDVQTLNNLTWNFTNLAPFETRTIIITLHLNNSFEVPPVNIGDYLSYIAMISGLIDETPGNNNSSLRQLVVSSHDPNDKICIEGTSVTSSTIGQYVHYMIGFENTGTANAQNIVVKDMIDTTKYDVTTMVPITGSAPFTTRITNTNQVEFIFQNINLPFTTGSNDGYVAFKIKTLPTLVVGDTFSNTANIYFDYNAPIVTNTATTTIAALANPTFAFSDYFTLSPIPTKGPLNINTKQDITITSISIYNTLGQVMLVTSNPSKTIDVSNLTTSSYFIKVITDKGTSNGKFMKE